MAWLRDLFCVAEVEAVEKHQEQLIEAAAPVPGTGAENSDRASPITGLFRTLGLARSFVHFATWGISHIMLGALKLLEARGVQVSGIVSKASAATRRELVATRSHFEALGLNIVAFPGGSAEDLPHQKLIVIDGLVAFKGSANFTVGGWRKASTGFEMVEAVVDDSEVIRLHNLYFSGPWLQFGHHPLIDTARTEIVMEHW